MSDVSFDLASLHAFYAGGGEIAQVLRLAYARHAAASDPGIFISMVPEAEAQAAALKLGGFDPVAKPLWGVPFAVKDNIDVAGMQTTVACPDYAYAPHDSAPVVRALLDAGAILIGKTNLDQFATGLVGVRTPYPVPKNPFDPSRIPGGSSSGSAVATARGIVSFALGTDTAGSGRIPAALNNLVGLKPSLGAISTRGVVPACRTLDCVSIFALRVTDARAIFDCIAFYDAQDAYSRPLQTSTGAVAKLGVPRPQDRLFFGDAHAEAAFSRALEEISKLGLPMIEIDMGDFFAVARLLYEGPWVAERHAAIRAFMADKPDALHPVTSQIISGAARYSATDAFEAFYALEGLRRKTSAIWSGIDALVLPGAPIAPTVAELQQDPILPNSRLGVYTNFVNLLDLCALALPGPFRDDGMPAGTMLTAPRGMDHALTDIGQKIFNATGGTAGSMQL
jgi:allophanate hydrolase